MRDGCSARAESPIATAAWVLGIGIPAGVAIVVASTTRHGPWLLVGLTFAAVVLGTLAYAAPRVASRLHARRSTALWLLGLGIAFWGCVQLLHAVTLFDETIRFHGYRWKNMLGVVLVVALAGWSVARHLNGRERWTSIDLRRCGLALLFPVFVATTFVLRGEFNWPLVAMYTLWALYAFALVPRLVATPRAWRFLLGLTWTATWAVLLGGIVAGVAVGQLTWMGTVRYAFAFALLPYSFGLEMAGLLGLALASTATSRFGRIVYSGSFALALALLLAAISRGALSFLLVTAVAHRLLRPGGRRIRVAVVGVTLLVVALVALQRLDLHAERIDSWSSGRLTLFDTQLNEFLDGRTPGDWLFGSSAFGAAERTLQTTDAVSEDARFARNNTDNVYLALVLNHGLLGLGLFLLPLCAVARGLARRSGGADEVDARRARLGLATLAGLAAQSLVSMTLPSMGNVVSIYLPLFWHAGTDRAMSSRESRGLHRAG